ncbi:PH domain-containing protein [Amycolatopsis solani]|uniref:PH domain-containing protein n=1 Tax=Amycolatopsis solani TaxID=3028615 RepID=UPI0025B1BCDB|nr:PH domain-containing protein [Amycolatopsis sp. MEP2-6]
MTDRVRSSGAYLAYAGFLLLIAPTGWPLLFAVGTGIYAVAEADSEAAIAAAVFGVPAVVLGWLCWRFLGRSCRRLPDGLRVRGFFRIQRVPWRDVVDVTASEFRSYGRGFPWGQVRVVFRRADGEVRTTTVASSYRSATVGLRTIRSWFPPGHPLHRPAPAPVVAVDLSGSPVLGTLRPQQSVRAIHTGLDAAVGAGAVYGLVRAIEAGLTWVAVPCALVLGGVAWLAVRIARARVNLTPDGLVNHGYFHDFTVAAAASDDFVLVPSGAGRSVRIVTDAGSLQPAAGAGFGDYPGETRRRLADWHARIRPRPA